MAVKSLTEFLADLNETLPDNDSTERIVPSRLRERIVDLAETAIGGTVGDATGDDAASIEATVAALVAAGGGTLNFGPRVYHTGETTITIPISVSVTAQRGAEIRYSGTGVALDIWGNVLLGPRTMVLPNIQRTMTAVGPDWDAGLDTTSTGVRLNACHYDTIHLGEVRNFRRGLVLRATAATGDQIDSGNCICNTIFVGQIINNWRSIVFEYLASPVAGANQNTFLGGVCRIDAAWNHEAGRDYIYMPDAENNLNTFVGVNLEKGGNERAIYCNSQENLWLNCRLEGASAGYVVFGDGSVNNTIIGGRTSSLSEGKYDTIVTDTGDGNKYLWANILGGKGIVIDFNSGVLRFSGNDTTPAVPISGYGANRLLLGNSSMLGVRHYGYMRQEKSEQTSGTTLTANKDHLTCRYGSPATITGIAGGCPSDIDGLMSVADAVGNITLTHTAGPTSGQGKFVLTAGIDKVMGANEVVLFRVFDGNLYQA